ncbi:hypothetical protein [Altererythrobacter xiamenensis]|uniref:hypothetical protein n=1 Tax=Altererythrobacter xiamenensis TaxID=1316679 RepID=UPI001178376B|nr:hypothetical protein [Altererythrobacter xiamenensis]
MDTSSICHHRQVIAKKPAALFICLAVAGCDPFDADSGSKKTSNEVEDASAAPQYGDVTRISGVFRFYFEISSIAFCPEPRACHERLRSSHATGCWVDFDDDANIDLNRIIGKEGRFEHEGDYWLEGKGQIAVQPGYFGHLGNYGCQVRITSVSAFAQFPD